MKLLKTRALILRSRPLGERDRLLSLFTYEQGKLTAVAPGARKVKSRLAAGVDYFNCGHFLLYRGKSLFTVTQLEIEINFVQIRKNIRAYACGMYFCELVEKLLEEGEPLPAVFNLLLGCWSCLDKNNNVDGEIMARFFELRLLALLGYRPHLQGCLYCGAAEGPFFWNNSAGGILCQQCRPRAGEVYALDKGTLALANHLLGLRPAKVRNIRAGDKQKKELRLFIGQFLQYWTAAGSLQGLSFLDGINNYLGDKS